MLATLPFELIDRILEHLAKHDLAHIMRCNKRLLSVSVVLLYKDLELLVEKPRYERDQYIEGSTDPVLMSTLAECKRGYASLVQSVTVTRIQQGKGAAGWTRRMGIDPTDENSNLPPSFRTTSEQLGAFLEAHEGKLREFKWERLTEGCRPSFLQGLIEKQGQNLTVLKLILPPAYMTPTPHLCKLDVGSLPSLRTLSFDLEWQLHAVQLYYFLRASPNLECLSCKVEGGAVVRGRTKLFYETARYRNDGIEIGLPSTEIPWAKVLEHCLFKSLERLKLKKLKLKNFNLTGNMTKWVYVDNLESLKLTYNWLTTPDALRNLRPETMLKLDTCKIIYRMYEDGYAAFHEFLEMIPSKLVKLRYIGIFNDDNPLESGLPFLISAFPLSVAFVDRHKDTLRYLTYNIIGRGDWGTYFESLEQEDPRDLIPRQCSQLREVYSLFQVERVERPLEPRHPDGIDNAPTILRPVNPALDKLDGLENLHNLLLMPGCHSYRGGNLVGMAEYMRRGMLISHHHEDGPFRVWVNDANPEPSARLDDLAIEATMLGRYVKLLATSYEAWFSNYFDREPTLKWVWFLGGFWGETSLGFRISWVRNEDTVGKVGGPIYRPRLKVLLDMEDESDRNDLYFRAKTLWGF
ncbi:hypothetical protein TWF694_009421 [Orbilia ellipsospora]|uniref:F-box domain-containing protein n=1 Tax=Orbilia ellipsospora TaxID=2528407 RepID=A0AAV9XAS6_9PEZI